eukprot:6210818-Pleurochrysis_carterae.AAC.6
MTSPISKVASRQTLASDETAAAPKGDTTQRVSKASYKGGLSGWPVSGSEILRGHEKAFAEFVLGVQRYACLPRALGNGLAAMKMCDAVKAAKGVRVGLSQSRAPHTGSCVRKCAGLPPPSVGSRPVHKSDVKLAEPGTRRVLGRRATTST